MKYHPLKHLRTICHHRHCVFRHCVRAGIPWRGLVHDLSKFSPTEFFEGTRFYTDGSHSPNEDARRKYGYSSAWLHHKGRNRHHFEYWSDYVPGGPGLVPVPMPQKYLCEMVCDRIAASKTYLGKAYTDGAPLAYFERRRDRIRMHPDTAKQLEDYLTLLRDAGEDALFAAMRRSLKK